MRETRPVCASLRCRAAAGNDLALGRPDPLLSRIYSRNVSEFLDASCQVRIARRRVLHLVQFTRKPAEVMDRPRRGAYGYGCVLNVPVGGHGENRFRFWQRASKGRPPLRIWI